MPLSGVRLEAITEAHLQGLIENEVREGRRIDYKEAVGARDEDKREFLADVSSFANAAGGDLVIGVAETDAVASELPGIPKASVEGEILRLENLIRDGIDPRIPGFATQAVDLSDESRAVLVVRIPRSWAAPHMVTFRGHSRFYTRSSVGKYPLDVTEIRAAFVAAESARTQLRSFRIERLGRVAANDGPVELLPNPKTVLHVVPVTAVDPTLQYDVTRLAQDTNSSQFYRPLIGHAWNHRINFDGALAWAPTGREEPGAIAYTQVFRSGAIEGAEAFMMRREYLGEQHPIPSTSFEKDLIAALGRYLGLLDVIGAPPPYVVALSLLDVRGLRMGVSPAYIDQPHPIDRDDLVLPEVLVEGLPTRPHTVLKPLFDAIWNAVGWPYSPNYDEAGEWHEPNRRG
jgi:hypothetical protein